MLIGVVAGFSAAIAQSLSYQFSRNFVTRHARGALPLLVLSHVIMGGLSLLALPFVWSTAMPGFGVILSPLLGATTFYVAGQAGLFLALRSTEASRVAPLLGLKVFVLAVLGVTVLGQTFSVPQWAAVVVCVGAAFLLNQIGGQLPLLSVVWIVVACIGYSLSDIEVKRLVDTFHMLSLPRASALAVFLSYLACGVAALVVLPFKSFPKTQWVDAVPFSLAWLVGMLFLFACFGSIGVVFGNIVQASRGVISVIMGFVIARIGFSRLEERTGRALLAKRIAAALLMFLSVALYYAGT